MVQIVDDEDKGVTMCNTLGGKRTRIPSQFTTVGTWIINESEDMRFNESLIVFYSPCYSNASKALADHVDDDDKLMYQIDTSGQGRDFNPLKIERVQNEGKILNDKSLPSLGQNIPLYAHCKGVCEIPTPSMSFSNIIPVCPA